MKSLSTPKKIAALAAITVGACVGVAAPAHANLYLYDSPGFLNQIGNFSSPMSSVHNISWSNNDKLSSFQNYTNYYTAFYHDAYAGGRCFTAAPGDTNAGLGFWDDNLVSSFWLGRAC